MSSRMSLPVSILCLVLICTILALQLAPSRRQRTILLDRPLIEAPGHDVTLSYSGAHSASHSIPRPLIQFSKDWSVRDSMHLEPAGDPVAESQELDVRPRSSVPHIEIDTEGHGHIVRSDPSPFHRIPDPQTCDASTSFLHTCEHDTVAGPIDMMALCVIHHT